MSKSMDNLTVVLITFEGFYNFFTDITLKGNNMIFMEKVRKNEELYKLYFMKIYIKFLRKLIEKHVIRNSKYRKYLILGRSRRFYSNSSIK